MKNVKAFEQFENTNEAINTQDNLKNMITGKHGYHVVEKPNFDVTENQVVLENKDGRYRIILDTEGQTNGECWVEMFAFTRKDGPLEWKVSFSSNVPPGPISAFLGQLS